MYALIIKTRRLGLEVWTAQVLGADRCVQAETMALSEAAARSWLLRQLAKGDAHA